MNPIRRTAQTTGKTIKDLQLHQYEQLDKGTLINALEPFCQWPKTFLKPAYNQHLVAVEKTHYTAVKQHSETNGIQSALISSTPVGLHWESQICVNALIS